MRLDTSSYATLIRERVARGAAWLDTVRPEWRENIDLLNLDIAHPHRCVLGQTFHQPDSLNDGFALGMDALYTTDERYDLEEDEEMTPAITHGFDTGSLNADAPYTYDELEAGWLDLLDPEGERA